MAAQRPSFGVCAVRCASFIVTVAPKEVKDEKLRSDNIAEQARIVCMVIKEAGSLIKPDLLLL